MKILFVQQEMRKWNNARMWGYNIHLGIAEGLRANGAEVTTLLSPWIPRAREIIGNQRFDQVWINDVTHMFEPGGWNEFRLTLDDLDWLAGLAPVRVGFLIESLAYREEDYAAFPFLANARTVLEKTIQYLTHVLFIDEKDEAEIRSLKAIPALWFLLSVPERLICREVTPPPSALPVFFGTPYGERAKWLERSELKGLLSQRKSKDNATDLPALFNRLHGKKFLDVPSMTAPQAQYRQYLEEIQRIRKAAYELYLESWLEGCAVVSLPSLGRVHTGAVYEGFALGRPVIAMEQPYNKRANEAFIEGDDILIYPRDNPEVLAEHIRHILRDPDFGYRIARNAHKKMLALHTLEKRAGQYLDWIDSGIEPDYIGRNADRNPMQSIRFERSAPMAEEMREDRPPAKEAVQDFAELKSSFANENDAKRIAAYEEYVCTFPSHALAHNDLGVLYAQSGNPDKALLHYESANRLEPDNLTFLKNLADFYFVIMKDMDKALPLYAKGLSIDPKDVEILMGLGIISIQKGLFAKAKIFYERIRELQPNNPDVLPVLDLLSKQEQTAAPSEETQMPAPASTEGNKAIHNPPGTEAAKPSPSSLKIHFVLDMDGSQAQFSPHFGIAYLSAYLKAKLPGIGISISYASDSDIPGAIRAIGPHLIGITSTSRRFLKLKSVAETLKNRLNLPMLWGGVHLSLAPQDLPECADIGVIGEGEETLLELLNNFGPEGFQNLSAIKGIVYRDRGKLVINEKRPAMPNLDDLPFPDTKLLRIDWASQQRAVIITSRGCPFKCRFCASSVFWDRARLHSAAYVVEEIRQLVKRDHVKEILIYDDFFTIDKKRIAEIARLISESPDLCNLKFECLSRVDGFDDDLAVNLKRMGMYKVSFGFESGCQRTLDYLKNGRLKLERSEKTVAIAKKHGLQCVGSFVIGSPDETEDEIRETFRFIEKLELDFVQITVATPFPGTAMWDDGKRLGVIAGDEWRDEYYAMFAFRELDGEGVSVREFLKNKKLLTRIDRERFIALVEEARILQMSIHHRSTLGSATLLDHIRICVNLAMSLRRGKKLGEAVSIMALIAAQVPDNVGIQNFLAELKLEAGDTSGAYRELLKIIDKWPTFQSAFASLGAIACRNGEPIKALPFLEKAYLINPGDRRAVMNYASILKRLGRTERQQEVARTYLAHSPDDQDVRLLAG